MGELFVNVHEYVPLIKDRMIDFIRVHMSDIGGSEPPPPTATFCGPRFPASHEAESCSSL